MATVGDLLVKIRADIKDLETKMNKAQTRVSKTQKSFQKDMGKTNKVSQGFQKRMSNAATATAALQGPLGPVAGRLRSVGALMGSAGFAAGVFVLAITGLVAAFRSLVMAASRAEQAVAKFDALVKATGGAAGLTSRQLELMAREFAQNTLFSVQQMRDAQGVLLTFKAVAGDAFGRTLMIASDVATVMGTDVKSAALQLGKALEEPRIGLSMLRRSGISFNEEQKKIIFNLSDTGQKAEAMSHILGIIEKQLGGVATTAAGDGPTLTLAGAFDELGRKFTLFQEELLGGTTLLRMFTQAVAQLADAIPAVDVLGMTDKDLEAQKDLLEKQIEQHKIAQSLQAEAMANYEPSISELFTGIPSIDLKNYDAEIQKKMELIAKIEKEIASRKELAELTLDKGPEEADSPIFIKQRDLIKKGTLEFDRLKGAIGKTGAELEIYNMKSKFLNDLTFRGITLKDSEMERLNKLMDTYAEHAKALEQTQKAYAAFENAVNKAFSTVENSIMGLIKGTESLKDVLKNMLQAFIADLTTSIIRMLILDRIKKSIMGSSTGSAISSIIGSIIGRNTGGTVGSKTPYVVGEQGPELFIPNTSGRIQPLNKAGGNMGSQQTPIVVEQHINFATGVSATVRAEVANLLPQIQNSTIAAVQEARLRGGKFAESFGG
jgi:phage-related minor tail protein